MGYFADLQRQSLIPINTVTESRQKLNKIVSIFKELPDHARYQQLFSEMRKGITVDILEEVDGFMVDEDYTTLILPEDLRHDSLGFCNAFGYVYEGRYVYPVKDVKGDVAGWCGYDNEAFPKYLDSINYGYRAKQGMLYGMEKMREYYESNEPVFITEGIVCTLWLRSNKFQAMALLGSYLSVYVAEILRRLGRRCIIVPDSDAAGNKLVAQAKRLLPEARVIQSRMGKDVDDSRQEVTDLADDLAHFRTPFGASKYFTVR